MIFALSARQEEEQVDEVQINSRNSRNADRTRRAAEQHTGETMSLGSRSFDYAAHALRWRTVKAWAGPALVRANRIAYHAFHGLHSRLGMRLLAVVVFALAGFIADKSELGRQLGWALHYFAAILMSLAVSYAGWILLFNFGFAALWFIVKDDEREPAETATAIVYGVAQGLLTWINRTLGHLEALLFWVLIVLTLAESLLWQVGLIAALALLSAPVLDFVALCWIHRNVKSGKSPNPLDAATRERQHGLIHWTRRPLINGATIVAAIVLWRLAPLQIGSSLILVAALGLSAAARLGRWFYRGKAANPSDSSEQFRRRHVSRYGWLDTPVVVAFVCVLAAFFWVFLREHVVGAASMNRVAPTVATETCDSDEASAITRPDVALMVMADSQLHKLDGARFPGQLEFANALVSVARRPVELDLLSEASLRAFGTTHKRLPGTAGRIPWVYLGDFADLSCRSELLSALSALDDSFGLDLAAGVAVGNHDSQFTGNFLWSRYWDGVCSVPSESSSCRAEGLNQDGRADKAWSDKTIEEAFRPGIEARGGQLRSFSGRSFSNLWRRGQGLAAVAPLGTVTTDGARRGLVGVFLDTSDSIGFDAGIAGLVGAVSERQIAEIRKLIDSIKSAPPKEGDWADPYFVFFAHHPISSLGGDQRSRLTSLVRGLEADGARVIGFVSAHTHRAQRTSFCLGSRRFDELTVGSTLDAPQEVAVLTVGTSAAGEVAMTVSTIAAVSRPEMSCGVAKMPGQAVAESEHPMGVPADVCKNIVNDLASEPECSALFARDDELVGGDCQDLERSHSVSDRLRDLAVGNSAEDPDAFLEAQRSASRQLFQCLCRGDRCEAPHRSEVLCGSVTSEMIKELGESHRDELVCLSWAASVLQAHKSGEMTMADALRCAFDDGVIQGEKRMTTTLGERACF